MKFIHTSDLHFGAGRRLTPKSRDYLDRHIKILNGIVKVAIKESVDFVLVAGDVFENQGTTLEELLAAWDFFRKLGEVCPVLVTPGNHDETTTGKFQLSYLKRLQIPNVTFVEEISTVEIVEGVKVFCMPWTGIKKQEEFEGLIRTHYSGEPIVMLHECFKGIVTDTGYRALGGVQVPDLVEMRYAACGDIHKMQQLNLPNAWYSGAPMQYNFGDEPGKGCFVVEVEGESYKPRFVKLPAHIELHLARTLEEIPQDTPHWWKLRVEAANVPQHLPENVKVLEILPTKIEMPVVEEGATDRPVLTIDYADGIEELLREAGFDVREMEAVTEEIGKVVKSL
jgi:DNA repair exonuclease SbcCD nuclease subunit